MKDDASSSSAPSPPQRTVPPVDENKPSTEIAPTHADFLYSYSTVYEHVSYRHSKLGNYFVQGLVEAFRERPPSGHPNKCQPEGESNGSETASIGGPQ